MNKSMYFKNNKLIKKRRRDNKIKKQFKERISPETLLRMKENTRINKLYIKNYPWEEDRFIRETKKKILEGI